MDVGASLALKFGRLQLALVSSDADKPRYSLSSIVQADEDGASLATLAEFETAANKGPAIAQTIVLLGVLADVWDADVEASIRDPQYGKTLSQTAAPGGHPFSRTNGERFVFSGDEGVAPIGTRTVLEHLARASRDMGLAHPITATALLRTRTVRRAMGEADEWGVIGDDATPTGTDVIDSRGEAELLLLLEGVQEGMSTREELVQILTKTTRETPRNSAAALEMLIQLFYPARHEHMVGTLSGQCVPIGYDLIWLTDGGLWACPGCGEHVNTHKRKGYSAQQHLHAINECLIGSERRTLSQVCPAEVSIADGGDHSAACWAASFSSQQGHAVARRQLVEIRAPSLSDWGVAQDADPHVPARGVRRGRRPSVASFNAGQATHRGHLGFPKKPFCFERLDDLREHRTPHDVDGR